MLLGQRSSRHFRIWWLQAFAPSSLWPPPARHCLSRRISKSSAGVITHYLYDGWNLIAEYTGTVLEKTYTWGMDLSGSMQGAGGVGGLLAVSEFTTQNSQVTIQNYYPTYDGNGNVSEYLDSASLVVAHFEYDPFGNTTVNTDTTGLFDILFSTKKGDLGTGLYYYGYRYYDPVTGRWPSRDPIEEKGGLNLYISFNNNSLNGVDVLGQYTLQADVTNGPDKEQLNKIKDSMNRIVKKIEDLEGKLIKIIECFCDEVLSPSPDANWDEMYEIGHPGLGSALARMYQLRHVLSEVKKGIKGKGNLEIQLKPLNGVGGTAEWYPNLGGMLDPVMTLNTKKPDNWEDWSDDELDVVIFHELTHIAASTKDQSPKGYFGPDPDNAHDLDNLMAITDLCQYLGVLMPIEMRRNPECCEQKAKGE